MHRDGKIEEAIAEYLISIALDPGRVISHYNRNALRDGGKLDEAIAEYREAIRLAPNEPAVWTGLQLAFRAKGNYKDLIQEYTGAIEKDPQTQFCTTIWETFSGIKAGFLRPSANTKKLSSWTLTARRRMFFLVSPSASRAYLTGRSHNIAKQLGLSLRMLLPTLIWECFQ